MEIKNLNQLKKALTEGREFIIRRHWRESERGQRRKVSAVQTNAIFSIIPDEPDSKFSKANHGKGYEMPFGKASDWKFEDGLCINYFKDGNECFAIEVL